MDRRIPAGRQALPTALLAAFLLAVASLPAQAAKGRAPFAGYTEDVRLQALRVVDAAGPGRETAVARAAGALRKRMLARGVLSMNDIPDLVMKRASREGWAESAAPSLRAAAPVAALSAPMWAWLIKEDVRGLRMNDLVTDIDGFFGALSRFGPALMGCTAVLLSLLTAAACWFVLWVSAVLFLRARPSLEHDISRLLNIPGREYLSPVLALLVFLLPLVGGASLAVVACFWLVVSAGYLRRAELLALTAAVLLLGGILVAGGALRTMVETAGDRGRDRWHAGEGWASGDREERAAGMPEAGAPGSLSRLIRFTSARARMQGGDPAEAERLWTELLKDGRETPEILNNRGIARIQQGKKEEALADFLGALNRRPGHEPAQWNAYQVYLQDFNLERAAGLQPQAWDGVRRMTPFRFRPSEMDQGEWVAAPLPIGEIWKAYMEEERENWAAAAARSELLEVHFRPFRPRGALAYVLLALLAAWIVKALSLKIWLSCTCRACGSRFLIVGSKQDADLCPPCKGQGGVGLRPGEERDCRVQAIGLHGRYVQACSLFAPGSGSLWAGKEVRALLYGFLLSLALGGVTLTLGGIRTGEALPAGLLAIVRPWAILSTAVLWIAGSLWSLRSFREFRQRCRIASSKR